jgi:hypothetical protein
MIGLLLALYPAPWRRRYEEEFRAVLESRPIGPFDVADILLGALDARARAVRLVGAADPRGGRHTMLRIGGAGALSGGTLWVGGFLGANLIRGDAFPWFVLIVVGTAGILLALVGLSAFQAHRSPVLAWAAFLIPGVGSTVSLIGLLGMLSMPDSDAPMIAGLSSWNVWALGSLATLVGCILFALATYQANVLSRAGARGLAISSAITLLLAMGLAGPADGIGAVLLVGSLLVFAGSWLLLGVSALRRGPIRAITTA